MTDTEPTQTGNVSSPRCLACPSHGLPSTPRTKVGAPLPGRRATMTDTDPFRLALAGDPDPIGAYDPDTICGVEHPEALGVECLRLPHPPEWLHVSACDYLIDYTWRSPSVSSPEGGEPPTPGLNPCSHGEWAFCDCNPPSEYEQKVARAEQLGYCETSIRVSSDPEDGEQCPELRVYGSVHCKDHTPVHPAPNLGAGDSGEETAEAINSSAPATTTEWGRRWPNGAVQTFRSREVAEGIGRIPGSTTALVHREVGEWHEVDTMELAEPRVWHKGDPEPEDHPTVKDRRATTWTHHENGCWVTDWNEIAPWDLLCKLADPLTEVVPASPSLPEEEDQ